jgi:hypothetical protein
VFSLEGVRYALLLATLTLVAGGAAFNAFEKEQHLNFWEGTY